MMAMALGCQHTFLRELEGTNDLFEIGREPRVVLFYQPDEFSLQARKFLDGNGTQGSIHGRASSS